MKAELDVNKTVKKSNILNEIRNANASLVEYRLFCVYLAHLSLKSEDNVVTFSLMDYARIAGLDRPRYLDLKAQAHNMVGLSAAVPNEDGGFSVYSLFSEFKLFREDEQWFVSLECNPKIAPMIREQKGRFLRYKLYNTIYLKSFNQQRIYELLKQYETIGTRLISLEDLRAFLGISEGEYSVWGDFSQKVLKVAQKALKESTDIYFEYEPVKKGRPVVAVKFTIFKNQEFVDLMEMDKFLPAADASEYEGKELVVRAADEDEFGENYTMFDDVDELELSREEIYRRECIDTVRGVMRDNYTYTEAELEEIVVAVETSTWWDAAKVTFMGDLIAQEKAFRGYVAAQYAYCKPTTKAKTKRGFLSYVVKGVRANWAGMPLPEEEHRYGNFDVNEAFENALKRTYGEIEDEQ
jgi:plasmid replication initiation protein